jgi:SAM-dependent methyltransferase
MTIGDFSAQAAAYERSRPGYPESLVDTLVAEASVFAGDAVVEFGAGTGIFTRMLLARDFDVTAVEPNEEMWRRAGLANTRWMKGSFESNSLSDASQNWAVAAQAFHWADPQSSLPQIRRALKSGSLFSALWNHRVYHESGVLKWTESAIRRHIPEFNEAYRNRSWEQVLESTGDFTFLSHRVVRHTVTMLKERYLDLWRSHNRLNNVAGADRFAIFFDDLTNYLEQRKIEQVDVPYNCEAWSARRND